ncbi:MAG TPA: hypothetical protein VL404_00140 [Candidatus Eisenbacteria bacterium]|jgi:F0F1-type ATP synthase epsilon subunit|nr:hypothetical protein [Candidatus Eisenbacteria bacterium]
MANAGDLNVLIATAERVLYEGTAISVILPGEHGVFEILAHHKPILSRLLGGKIIVDGKAMPVRRGVAKASMNQVTVIVEES